MTYMGIGTQFPFIVEDKLLSLQGSLNVQCSLNTNVEKCTLTSKSFCSASNISCLIASLFSSETVPSLCSDTSYRGYSNEVGGAYLLL